MYSNPPVKSVLGGYPSINLAVKSVSTAVVSACLNGKNKKIGCSPAKAEEIRKAVEKLNEQLKPVGAGVRFNVDDESGRLVIQLMDVANDTVIRQIPSEEALKLSREPDLKRSGLLLNTKA